METQLNTYHFGRHRNLWGIWFCDHQTATTSSSTFVKDVPTYEMAVVEVYRLNGTSLL